MSPKTFLILGGTGASGILVTERALHNKHRVVLYVRNPAKLPAHISSNSNVTVVTGTLDDEPAFQKAFHGVDVVVSLLGPTPSSPNPTSPYYPIILRLMRASGVNRLVYISTFAISQPEDSFALSAMITRALGRLAFPKGIKNVIDTHEILQNSAADIDRTEVRVGMLKDDEQPGEILTVGNIGDPSFSIFIRRRHIAEFLVGEAERGADQSIWIRRSPGIWTSKST